MKSLLWSINLSITNIWRYKFTSTLSSYTKRCLTLSIQICSPYFKVHWYYLVWCYITSILILSSRFYISKMPNGPKLSVLTEKSYDNLRWIMYIWVSSSSSWKWTFLYKLTNSYRLPRFDHNHQGIIIKTTFS